MLRDVTLGRYIPGKSVLHGLDPRVKLAGLLVYAVCVFLCSGYVSAAVCLLVLAVLVLASGVPVKYMFRGLAPLAAALAVITLLRIFVFRSGVWRAFLAVIRMVELIAASNLVALTTRPSAIADALEKGLSWMEVLRVPVHDLVTIISIAFRFIPILSDEARRIMEAQKARGAGFRAKGLSGRAGSVLPVLVPLFASAFRKAGELGTAMDCRLYGTGKATSLNPLSYDRCDAAAYVFIIVFLAVAILMKVAGL